VTDERGDTPLHAMNPTGRFSDRADDYVKFRPDYPAAAIDAVLAGLHSPVFAADVGAGTGISARHLAERGARVIAIEPNAAMREAAEPHPRVEWRDGAAEATGLADGEVNLVACAQAFHWFRPREALAEFARVLAPGGRVALWWNTRDDADALTTGYKDAIRAVGGEHPAEARDLASAAFVDGLRVEPLLRELEALAFSHAQALDEAGLLGRATSASYVPREGARLEELRARLAALHARHADARGLVHLRYVTRVYRLTRAE
jgi:SAM-dependent methyltransferase